MIRPILNLYDIHSRTRRQHVEGPTKPRTEHHHRRSCVGRVGWMWRPGWRCRG